MEMGKMVDFSRNANGEFQENGSPKRVCDFCGESKAILYCRADTAKLCLSCDGQVHLTNQIFTKHTRSLLCDVCDSSPSSVFCSNHSSVLCQSCDWKTHKLSSHDRRPIEGFNGCPSIIELLACFGIDDLGKNKKKIGERDRGFLGFETNENSDNLSWNTPSASAVNFTNLIVSTGFDHTFTPMGFPPLPKNRNTICGQHKDEIICQLRKLANLEDDQIELEPSSELHSLVASRGSECPTYFPSSEASVFQWCFDATGQVAGQVLSSNTVEKFLNTNCTIPDKDTEIGQCLQQGNNGDETQSGNTIIVDTPQILPKVAPRDLFSPERQNAIKRYKEKRNSRRYDKQIRYESRKIRAESRTRIRGRFAKTTVC